MIRMGIGDLGVGGGGPPPNPPHPTPKTKTPKTKNIIFFYIKKKFIIISNFSY